MHPFRSLVPSLLGLLLSVGCSAAPDEASGSTASELTLTPINGPGRRPPPIQLYTGPSHSPSALAFGTVDPSIHYEQTVWFTIDQADSFSARIASSHSGVVHITRMQAWWNAWGCSVGSSNPACFDASIGGAGTLGVDAGEVVGVTVSIDPSFSAAGAINSQLIVSGTNGAWSEIIPITGSGASCSQATHGSYLSNIGVRYNDIVFTLDSGSDIRWGWKVTSGNLQSWGELPPGSHGGNVDVGAHFFGPPYSIMPNTKYVVSFYPGGLASPCAPINRTFTTPPDPTPQCVIDHACPGDPGSGDGGGDNGGDGRGGTTLDDPPESDPPVPGL